MDGYAGDVSPEEAYALLCEDETCVLIDVRTHAEWNFVGRVDLSKPGKAALHVEWQRYPDMDINARFVEEVESGLAQEKGRGDVSTDKGRTLLLLCRSGVRSVAAAQTLMARGYERSFNVAQGFEGGLDAHGHRGAGGWKAQGLPWMQK